MGRTLNIKTTPYFEKVFNNQKRYCLLQGGTRSGKTFTVLQSIIVWAIQNQQQKTVSIVRKTLPSLKKSVLRDFIDLLVQMNIYNPDNHNKSENTYTIGKTLIEFFSIDDAAKYRGSKRDILYLNEGNELTFEDFFQLNIRTTDRVLIDFNPSDSQSWIYDLKEERPNEVNFFITTYKDNPFLEQNIIDEIERLMTTDEDYWRIYGLGLPGSNRHLIYRYNQIDEIPREAKLLGVGLDWGYSNDPTAIVEVYQWLDELYLNELVYLKALTNQDISRQLEMLGIDRTTEIIADSAEPKSIEELYRMGFNVKPAKKGPDSVLSGIDILKRHKINVTKQSTNIIKELNNYKWIVDKDNNILNKPVDAFNHGMDAVRYLALNKLAVKPKGSLYVKGL